jgi:hypothetical protein
MATDFCSRRKISVYSLSCLIVLLLSLVAGPFLMGQTASTGALVGTVKDSSGAVVANATVTATNVGTNQARTTTTTSDGGYKFGFLPPGTYKVKFEAAGFSTAETPSVLVSVTETPVLDQTLSVGGQAQQVEVRGEAESVQTASSTVGTVVGGKTITDLPLTSRNYTTLLGLAAGANTSVYNASSLGRGNQDIMVNGSSTAQNNFQMDGASILNFNGRGNSQDVGANPGISIVNPDAIEEFKIQTSLFDAGYGRNPGGNVNVVTKGGTNQYHGSAFEFFRNRALNANDYFRKLSPAPNNTKQALDQHQFGGTFGGPVIKDKLFFFASFQETRQKNGISPAGYSNPTLVGIPQGDRSNTAAFRSALGSVFCPTGTSGGNTSNAGAGVTQVACNGSNINPVAVNILQLKNADGSYYIPSSSTGQRQNVTYSFPAIYKEHQAVGNFDYLLTPNQTVSGRWFYSRVGTAAPIGCAITASAISLCLPGAPATTEVPSQYMVLKLTSILSNTIVNEARASLQRVFTNLSSDVPFTDTQVGIAPIVPSMNLLNAITVTGLMTIGGNPNLTSTKGLSNWELADQISWSHGKHTTRAGFEFERNRVNWKAPGVSTGTMTFQTFQDFLLGLPGCVAGTSAPACAASAAAGTTNGSTTSNIANTGTTAASAGPQGTIHYFRATAANAFVQDDYKVSSNLTLNLGVRWEYFGMIKDEIGQLTNVWPSLINTVPLPGGTAATGTLAGFVVPANFNFAANPAPPVGGLYQNNQDIPTQNSPSIRNFAPRVGFAWKPLASDKFVVRGGAGYFYDRPGMGTYSRIVQGTPYSVTLSRSGTSNAFSSFAQPYGSSTLGWTPRFATINTTTQTGTSSNLSVFAIDPNWLTPTTYRWNLNIQYEFLPKWVLEVGYVGSRGLHLVADGGSQDRQINGALLASPTNPVNGLTTNTVANALVRVPYLGFAPAGFNSSQTYGDSKFNSLQATVRKQFSHGLQMQAAYTFSRSYATQVYNFVNDPMVPKYGPYIGYRPHRLTFNYSWDLPLGNREGMLGKVLNGWSVAGVTVLQSGQPLTILDTRGGSIYGFGVGSPVSSSAQFAAGKGNADVASSGDIHTRLGGAAGGAGYFNASAFGTTPVIGNGTGYGNSGLGIILGPGQNNFDATLQKTTRVGGLREDANLVFRTEFFNMFNHAQFSNPTGAQTQLNAATFGQITSMSVNPRLIQFALKYVF